MKPALSLLLGIYFLSACQVSPASAPTTSTDGRSQSQVASFASSVDVNPLKLPLSAALLQELQQPDGEADPSEPSNVSDQEAEKVLSPRYVHAHSYYFEFLDNGKSTVERILEHDGQTRAAELVTHWRKVLSDGSIWPDRNSTTYGGRFTALEHGQTGKTKGWLLFRNASTKAQEYYQLALKAWKPGVAADHPSQSEAWAWLGRTCHFLQDMSVPFHTKSFVRPSQVLFHHPYELTSERLFDRYLPSRNHNPFGVWPQGGPYSASGNWGYYSAPGTSAESMITQLASQSQPFYKMVNELENSKTGNWEKSRAVLIPLGGKMTAGLVMAYLNEVGALKR